MGKTSKGKAKQLKKTKTKNFRLDTANDSSADASCKLPTSRKTVSAVLPSFPSEHLPQPFPGHLARPEDNDFLLDQPPFQESFQSALRTSYEGFVVDPTLPALPESHNQDCLESMERDHYFRRDVTQPFGLGTKCAKTYVTRCLVGDPGTTYKYLGLRMFAHPWSGENNEEKRVESQKRDLKGKSSNSHSDTFKATRPIFRLKEMLSARTKEHLKQLDKERQRRGAPSTQGRSEFDICLINRMDPNAMDSLKPEPSQSLPHLGTSVSWHADSSLEHYSAIAVYQTLLPANQQKPSKTAKLIKNTTDQWYVAMRVAPHCEGPTSGTLKRKSNIESTIDRSVPPIAVSLPSGSTYYLLDDFNHHHQHTVLLSSDKKDSPASCIRYSCTFRLLRDSHNVEHMLWRCRSAISNFHKKGSKVWRSEQLLLNELESEWIRQFFIQGSQHYELLWEVFWKQPMEQLLKYWSQLEQRTNQTFELLQYAAQGKCSASTIPEPPHTSPPSKAERKLREKQRKALTAIQGLVERMGDAVEASDFYEVVAEQLEKRARLRELWTKREKDHVFTELSEEMRPIPVPCKFSDNVGEESSSAFTVTSLLPGSPSTLREMATSLRACGKAFLSGKSEDLPAVSSPPTKPRISTPIKDADEHAKSLDWSGWAESNLSFGLELQHPWASAVIDGRKAIETRAYDLPPGLIGKRIWVLESTSGTAGVSNMGNTIDLEAANGESCKVIGWCRFTSVVRYASRTSFEADEARHLVSSNSGYAWKEGKTQQIFGWVVGSYGRAKDPKSDGGDAKVPFLSAVRRMRSLFELKPADQQTSHHSGKTKRKCHGSDGKNSSLKPGRRHKKKRY